MPRKSTFWDNKGARNADIQEIFQQKGRLSIYVNALSFGFDPRDWLSRVPLERVVQMHIAGHQRRGDLVLDTHGAPVIDPVLDLMRWVLPRIGRPVPVLLERDNDIPGLDDLLAERAVIQEAYDAALAERCDHA